MSETPSGWQATLDERQRKEVAFAQVYAAGFAHGTTGHNQLVLIAHLAALLDEAAAGGATFVVPDRAEQPLGFGKYAAKSLNQIIDHDPSYVMWLAGEARDPAIREAAQQLLQDIRATHHVGAGDEEETPF